MSRVEEARELQDQEISLLECVYGEDLVVHRSRAHVSLCSSADADPTRTIQLTSLKENRGNDEGRVQRIEIVLARECPSAVLLTAAERRAGVIPKGVPEADFVWAIPNNNNNTDNNGAAASVPVPVGYVAPKPTEVRLTIDVPCLYPFEPLRHWRVEGPRLSKAEQREVAGAVADLVADLTGVRVRGIGGSSELSSLQQQQLHEASSSAKAEAPAPHPSDPSDPSPVLQVVVETAREHLFTLRREEAEDAIEREKRRVERGARRKDRRAGGGGGNDDDDDDDDGDEDVLDEEAQLLLYQHKAIDTTTLGRRCVYFHHILSRYKRCVITNMARRLELRGFCKIGYPGILIIEGAEGACEVYVQVLQRLRWKLMVVRGEERIQCPQHCTYTSLCAITPLNLRTLFGGTPVAAAPSPSSSNKGEGTLASGKKSKITSKTSKVNPSVAKSTTTAGRDGTDEEDEDDEGGGGKVSVASINKAAALKAAEHLSSRPVLETGSAEEIASWCALCGLSTLFRTVMKIYN